MQCFLAQEMPITNVPAWLQLSLAVCVTIAGVAAAFYSAGRRQDSANAQLRELILGVQKDAAVYNEKNRGRLRLLSMRVARMEKKDGVYVRDEDNGNGHENGSSSDD